MTTDTTPVSPDTVSPTPPVATPAAFVMPSNGERVQRMREDLQALADMLPTLVGSGVPVSVSLSPWGEANVHLSFSEFMDAHMAGLLDEVSVNEVYHNHTPSMKGVPTLHYKAPMSERLPSGTRVMVVACQEGKAEPAPVSPPPVSPVAPVPEVSPAQKSRWI